MEDNKRNNCEAFKRKTPKPRVSPGDWRAFSKDYLDVPWSQDQRLGSVGYNPKEYPIYT